MLAHFLNNHDVNMKQPRFDFVAIRSDGTAARFHPGSKGPGVVAVGQLSDWTVPIGAPACVVGPVMKHVTAPAEKRGAAAQHFGGAHQTGVTGCKATVIWLAEQLVLWRVCIATSCYNYYWVCYPRLGKVACLRM